MNNQKKNIKPLLLTILRFLKNEKGEEVAHGLLTEESTLGLKRKLQKIRTELLLLDGELSKDHADILRTYSDKFIKANEGEELTKEQSGINQALAEEQLKEIEILFNESFVLKAELASLSEIEKIETNVIYDFELIDLIAK